VVLRKNGWVIPQYVVVLGRKMGQNWHQWMRILIRFMPHSTDADVDLGRYIPIMYEKSFLVGR